MRAYAYAILVTGWLAWLAPFLLQKRSAGPPKERDGRARWGVLLVANHLVLWQSKFWKDRYKVGRCILDLIFSSTFPDCRKCTLGSGELTPALIPSANL